MNTINQDFMSQFFSLQSQNISLPTVFLALGLTCILSLLIAVVYQYTFRGFTYSRSYIHALVLGAIVTCTLIMAVGSNVARGLGILGTLTIIRFRTPVRDPRDAVFLFASLGAGIACGAGGYIIAVAGTLFFALIGFILHVLPFASRREYEGMLRFAMKVGDKVAESKLHSILSQYCVSFAVLGVCDCVQGESTEFAYQVRLTDPAYQQDLVSALKKAECFESPTLILQRNTVEL